MLFLNSRARNIMVAPMNSRGVSYTNKFFQPWLTFGSILLVIGAILIVVGVMYEVKNTKYIGIGFIGLGAVCFLSKMVHYYGKLDICYNNWIYRRHVTPMHNEAPQPKPQSVISIPASTKSSDVTHTTAFPISAEASTCRTIIFSIEIDKAVAKSSIKNDTMINNPINHI
ncbi:unnamed protein product [Rotaria magnacalcarata]|uniref:Uncharacterized protein n=1 Tax=Rotaria magnacalcarata TaxID=392030 RepID=A0A815U183_9BILA|nr:unnamed protein product [Rotaria magnacalcarata]CAF1611312.1 unnamed protein product [Rotaria magnacalcarata]CAF1927475.1 unnamed protein product [Rotaria magnacalcarata]CAF2053573.1 unnamed protein product [Rotaria magnacalcarata]CAF2079235.1 unnamed protein product [Rotaria magnacalcarata]